LSSKNDKSSLLRPANSAAIAKLICHERSNPNTRKNRSFFSYPLNNGKSVAVSLIFDFTSGMIVPQTLGEFDQNASLLKYFKKLSGKFIWGQGK